MNKLLERMLKEDNINNTLTMTETRGVKKNKFFKPYSKEEFAEMYPQLQPAISTFIDMQIEYWGLKGVEEEEERLDLEEASKEWTLDNLSYALATFFFDINMPELPPSRAPIVRRFKKKFPDIYKDAMEKYKEGEHDT